MYESDDMNVPAPGLQPCGLCGKLLSSSPQYFCLVSDSSAIHPHDPGQDGQRLVAACCAGHLSELQERYRRRPFTREELWAGKIARALRAQPRLDEELLVTATGLNFIQVASSLSWEVEHFLRRGASPGNGSWSAGNGDTDDAAGAC
ncbi:hypothetical protein [Streptomyces sp. NBRC 110611]|uniref:hypothetical protein n=1 Tax=Streptomyces sp. NBRC 110611 TaxID=1621259 RepID=UPI000A91FA87|nr:hypothetical protein [Streptomyces sp. NBRC 110611]